jgi:hypothetical protein
MDSYHVPIGAGFILGLELRECIRPATYLTDQNVWGTLVCREYAPKSVVICVYITLPHLVFN